jgi:hypothetical protein
MFENACEEKKENWGVHTFKEGSLELTTRRELISTHFTKI